MDLYFGGAEQPAWVTLLYDNGVRHMSLSFMGLRRRVKRLDRWRLADKFPADVKIYLDSGAFTLNKQGSSISAAEAAELRESYFQFVSDNIHDLEFASEFDASVLGQEAIHASRDSFWSTLPPTKWMPVWHADYGTSHLVALADEYPRVGVLQDDVEGDLTPVLNRMSASTKLHGVSMTRQSMMEGVRWSSVGSARWLAVTQFGETFVWTGRELKDYPRKQQEQGRKRHRTWLTENGFDAEAIEAGDSAELLKLSVWSWQKYAAHLNEVTAGIELPDGGMTEQPAPGVDPPAEGTGNETGGRVAIPRDRQLLPVVGFSYTEPEGDEAPEAHMTTPGQPLLQCNTCFMKSKCPAMQPGSACLYEIPVQIRTPGQLEATQSAILEMQAQRVLLMRMIEQTEGGYADPNLSAEISKLWKMMQDRAGGKDTVKLTLEGSGQAASAGMISRIFGESAGQRLHALEAPQDTQDVIEAEVIDNG